jgi:hypothetical protein
MIVVLFLVGPVGTAWDDSLEYEEPGDGSDDEPVGLESCDTPEDEQSNTGEIPNCPQFVFVQRPEAPLLLRHPPCVLVSAHRSRSGWRG